MAEPRKIIIDTDPGQDDAAAIMLAFGSPEELEVLGITTVAGNVPLSFTSRNARIICELCERTDIKVFAGADRPIARNLVTAEHVHGKTGLDGPTLPQPTMPLQAQHSVDFIIETLRREPEGTVTLCTLGPLTNIGLAFQKAPDIVPRIRELVMMGGGFFEGGNITPAAEFNIYVDPEAADIVFRSGVPVVMMPLDVTHQLLTRKDRVKRMADIGTAPAKAMVEMLEFFERFDIEKYGSDGGPLHDPTTIAYLLKPDLFRGRDCNVEIEVTSELTVGMTVVDWWHVTDRKRNAKVMRSVDSDGFFDLLIERFARI
ncbi:purine nucleosidase [Rhizobium sp. BK512]|uniref:nucleoside hydrolase n=1 Tax=Rhizobium sp. BK512 TaxID=2587010 RepID=UPI00161662F2|nr:nucleoside hydrolase [Rhizobium sp. BK512]MBB3562136.1 purine nucleosidase [Rhizobium sp. BK512]